MSTIEARLAEILATHHAAQVDLAPDQQFRFSCTCGASELVGGTARRAGRKLDWLATHQAAMLAPAIAKVRAEALREAADEVGAWGMACIPAAQSLRARADRLAPE